MPEFIVIYSAIMLRYGLLNREHKLLIIVSITIVVASTFY